MRHKVATVVDAQYLGPPPGSLPEVAAILFCSHPHVEDVQGLHSVTGGRIGH